MGYRDVTNDDVGEVIEVRDHLDCNWVTVVLEHILSKQDNLGFRYIAWGIEGGDAGAVRSSWRYARIATNKLPAGYLPSDWRELKDNGIIQRGDAGILIPNSPKVVFNPDSVQEIHNGWMNRTVGDLLSQYFRGGVIIRPKNVMLPNPHF